MALTESERKLVTRAQKGDRDAFEEIVRMYEKVIAMTVTGMLGNTQEAEDIGQETFIRFYRNLGSFRGDSGIKTYLTRIAVNLSLNELKKRRRLWRLFSPVTEKEENIADKSDSPYEQREKKQLVKKAIDRLPPDSRSVVVLRLMAGLTPQETASVLEIPVGTVFSRLSRAQDKLRNILEPIEKEIV